MTQKISFAHFSHAVVEIGVKQQACDQAEKYDWARHLWIHIMVLIIAGASAYFSWKYLYLVLYMAKRDLLNLGKRKKNETMDITATFELMESKNDAYARSMKKGPYRRSIVSPRSDRHSVSATSFAKDYKDILTSKPGYKINKWNIMCLIGNIVQLGGVCIYLFDLSQRLTVTNLFFGIGCFLAWLNVARYLEYSQKYFIMFTTLFTALPTSLRFVAANVPFLFGYAFLGTCLFWKSERFSSFSRALMTEFALFLGDSVFDIFTEITAIDFWFGQLYLCTFLLMFFTVVQNFFISIIQFAYFSFEDLSSKRAKLLSHFKKKDMAEEKPKVYPSKEAELTDLKKKVPFWRVCEQSVDEGEQSEVGEQNRAARGGGEGVGEQILTRR